MKFISMILPLSNFVLPGQVYANFSTEIVDKPDDRFSREISVGLLQSVPRINQGLLKKLTKESPSSSFSQSLATYTIDFAALCESQNIDDWYSARWEYSFAKAWCDRTGGNKRLVQVICSSRYNYHKGPIRWRRGRRKTVPYVCPERTSCQKTFESTSGPGRKPESVACVDEGDVRTDLVTPANSHADPNEPNVHCGLSLAIPGTEFTVNPGIHSIDVTLTEEARFKDGSPYPAPMIYIRDKTSRWGIDRVFRRHASVASAKITLTAVKGKFQTRTFEFCMQLLPGLTSSAVTFSYSWFQTTGRRGRISGMFLLNSNTYNDTGTL